MRLQADAVLISSMDGRVYCLDLDTGSTLWSYSTGVENATQALAPIVDSYSNIYFLERDKLTALDERGRTLWNEVWQHSCIDPALPALNLSLATIVES